MRILSTLMLVLVALVALGVAFLYRGDLPAEFVDQKYSSDESRFLETDTARIHYRDRGSGDAIVLIHGSNASLHTWEPWVDILSEAYRVVTIDLPGHGLTGRVADDDYSTGAYIRTVNAVVDELGIDTFVLGGNSMGGGVTWNYALAHPERVERMILVDSSGLWSWREESTETEPTESSTSAGETEAPPLAFQLLQQPWFRSIARYLDPRMLVEQGLRSAYNNSPVVTDDLIDRYYELSLREGTRDATLARFSGFRRDLADEPDLSVLTQPTLIMWGAMDSLIPVETAYRFEAVLPNASVVVYDDLGHIPMEEAPGRTAQDVLDFLERSGNEG